MRVTLEPFLVVVVYANVFIIFPQAPNLLSAAEENRVNEILNQMAETVRKRRLMVYPYFKDFDRVNEIIFDLSIWNFLAFDL